MPSIPIRIPTSSAPGMRGQEGGGRLINAFSEKAPDGAPSDIITRRSPGLTRATMTSSRSHTRGFQDNGTNALWILDDRVLKIDTSYTLTDLGLLSGTDFVTTARNNNATPDMVAVTSVGAFNLFASSAPTPFADPDLPGSPTSVCDFDGYFVFSYADGKIYASDLNSVNVNALSFNTEQGLVIRRVVRYGGRLFAFGDKWTGVYRDAGTQPFPFAREVTIPRGIIGTHAIAGWETGWANQLIFVGDDFIVYKLDGYTPTPVGNPDLSRNIQTAVLAGQRANIIAYVYVLDQNPFWVVTCKDYFTWEFNVASGAWNERRSYYRECWKGSKTLRFNDQWLVGDDTTGELYYINGNYFLEGIDPFIWEVQTGVMANFPFSIGVGRASFNMTMGVGTLPTIPDPKVEISWSLDGGYTYIEPVIRPLGGPGETKSNPYVLTCGITRGQGIRFKLRVSDAVRVRLFGGSMEAQQLAFAG
jgi:hypothetical protein